MALRMAKEGQMAVQYQHHKCLRLLLLESISGPLAPWSFATAAKLFLQKWDGASVCVRVS